MPSSDLASGPSTSPPDGVLDPRWRYRSRRESVYRQRDDETDRRIYDETALMTWHLQHPSGWDYLLRGVGWFTYNDCAAMRRAVERLRRLAHLAIDRTADDALRRWGC